MNEVSEWIHSTNHSLCMTRKNNYAHKSCVNWFPSHTLYWNDNDRKLSLSTWYRNGRRFLASHRMQSWNWRSVWSLNNAWTTRLCMGPLVEAIYTYLPLNNLVCVCLTCYDVTYFVCRPRQSILYSSAIQFITTARHQQCSELFTICIDSHYSSH